MKNILEKYISKNQKWKLFFNILASFFSTRSSCWDRIWFFKLVTVVAFATCCVSFWLSQSVRHDVDMWCCAVYWMKMTKNLSILTFWIWATPYLLPKKQDQVSSNLSADRSLTHSVLYLCIPSFMELSIEWHSRAFPILTCWNID